MYVYEGEDYSKSSDDDKKSFDQLLAGTCICSYYVLVLNISYILPTCGGGGGCGGNTEY
jgi:hypothetical protein